MRHAETVLLPPRLQVDLKIPDLGCSAATALIPRLVAQFPSPVSEVRRLCLGCVNLMVQSMPAGMEAAMEPYLQGMFSLATDKHSGVRRLVCAGLVQMLQLCPDMLEPHMRNIIEYMLHSTSVRCPPLPPPHPPTHLHLPSPPTHSAQPHQMAHTVGLPAPPGRRRGGSARELRVLERLLRGADPLHRACRVSAAPDPGAHEEHDV